MYSASGDSITRGGAVPNPYPATVGAVLGATFANYGIDGAMSADLADGIHARGSAVGDKHILAIGISDARTGNSTRKAYFGLIHKSLMAFLAIPDSAKKLANGGGITYAGAWSAGAWYKYSSAVGSTATFTFTGDNLYVSTLLSDPWNGTYSIAIDGVAKESGSCAGSGQINTVQGRPYAPRLTRLSGLGAGDHTCVITHTGGNYIGFSWAAAPTPGADVYVGNITRMTASGYGALGGNDARTDEYNAVIAANLAELAGDGLSIKLVDNHAAINPAIHISADGIHPNQDGTNIMASGFIASIQGAAPPVPAPTYTATSTFFTGDGKAYIDVNGVKREIALLPI